MIAKPGKDAKNAKSYRPISLLCACGKLFERILNARILCHLKEHQFFNDWQRAYLPKKHAGEIIYKLTEEIRYAKASKRRSWHTTAFSLDVEKAFDAVWHDGLRYKLMEIGLPAGICRILSSFLQDRTVEVRIRDTLSNPVPLRAGTPQGSVLSPLLYIIYVNDAPLNTSNGVRAGQFADDISGWTTATSLRLSQIQLQKTLNGIEKWCARWHIKMNGDKSQVITFKRGESVSCNLNFFGKQLTGANNIKVLGMTLGKTSIYTEHCKAKAAEANKRTNLLKLIGGKSWGANKTTLLRLYKQYIRPVLEYGAVAFTEDDTQAVYHLELAERRALRVVLHSAPRASNKSLYEDSGLQPISERIAALRTKAIASFDHRSKGLMDLATLKEIIGV